MMQRVGIVSALLPEPELILADEPTSDLDIPTLSVLEDYLDSFAGAVIAVSHDRFHFFLHIDSILSAMTRSKI